MSISFFFLNDIRKTTLGLVCPKWMKFMLSRSVIHMTFSYMICWEFMTFCSFNKVWRKTYQTSILYKLHDHHIFFMKQDSYDFSMTHVGNEWHLCFYDGARKVNRTSSLSKIYDHTIYIFLKNILYDFFMVKYVGNGWLKINRHVALLNHTPTKHGEPFTSISLQGWRWWSSINSKSTQHGLQLMLPYAQST